MLHRFQLKILVEDASTPRARMFWFLPSPAKGKADGDSYEGDAGYPTECPSRASLVKEERDGENA